MHRNGLYLIIISQIPITLLVWSKIDDFYAQAGLGFALLFLLNLLVFVFGAFVPKALIFNYALKDHSFAVRGMVSLVVSFLLILLVATSHLTMLGSVLLASIHTLLLSIVCWFEKHRTLG